MAQILCGLSNKVLSTFMAKFGIIELFILILDIPPLYTSCYVVTTSKIELYLIPVLRFTFS